MISPSLFSKGIIYVHYIPQNNTVSAGHFMEALKSILKVIKTQRPYKWNTGWILHMDHARPHAAKLNIDFIKAMDVNLGSLTHPPLFTQPHSHTLLAFFKGQEAPHFGLVWDYDPREGGLWEGHQSDGQRQPCQVLWEMERPYSHAHFDLCSRTTNFANPDTNQKKGHSIKHCLCIKMHKNTVYASAT